MIGKSFLMLSSLLVLVPGCAWCQSNFSNMRAAAVKECEKIDPGQYESGLLFNPDGYRTYYVRSECMQRAAVQFRDASLCDHVRRKFSLFFSSWAVSSAQCQKLVFQGILADRAELGKERQGALANPLRLLGFRIQRNGNGRDFDILPEFSSGYAHGYHLMFEIVGVREQPILIHSDGYYIDTNSRLNIYVRQSDIRARFPEFQLNHPYAVRATMIISTGMGGQSGYWSDEFIESVFPLRERTQTLTSTSTFQP